MHKQALLETHCTNAMEPCKFQTCDPNINEGWLNKVRLRFRSTQISCSDPCRFFSVYPFVILPPKYARPCLKQSHRHLCCSQIPSTHLYWNISPLYLSALVTLWCTPFWIHPATSCNAYLYTFHPLPLSVPPSTSESYTLLVNRSPLTLYTCKYGYPLNSTLLFSLAIVPTVIGLWEWFFFFQSYILSDDELSY